MVAAALVSDWFFSALEPAIHALGISQAFAGLVVVAIAGNAIENVVGIQLAYRNQADFALSGIIQSPLQVALVLVPALTLVFAPLLVMAIAITEIAVAFIVFDAEATWLEGAILIALTRSSRRPSGGADRAPALPAMSAVVCCLSRHVGGR